MATVVCMRGYKGRPGNGVPAEVDFSGFLKPILEHVTCGHNNNMKISVHTTPLARARPWGVYSVSLAGGGVQLRCTEWRNLPNSGLVGECFSSKSAASAWAQTQLYQVAAK